MKRIYLDNAAATPMDKKVLKKMLPFLKDKFGNPSSIYKEGVVANSAMREARDSVARSLCASSHDVFFTGSGTESDNLAIRGVVESVEGVENKPHIITSVIEHPAVLDTIKKLEKKGDIDVTYVSVDKNGIIYVADIKKALQDNTVLVSVVYANSEIGTVQPIKEIIRAVKEFRKSKKTKYPYVHTDACQATNYLDMSLERLGVDLLTLNASKIYGPKGVGVLCVRRSVGLTPIIFGGGQESGLRSGTENVAGVVGLAKALEITQDVKEKEVKRLTELRDYFIKKLTEILPQVVINGDKESRLPNNVHITIPDIEDDVLVLELDSNGVACSSKSACKESSGEDSYVILAIDGSEGSHLRFSMGRNTTKKDLDRTVSVLSQIIEKYKKL